MRKINNIVKYNKGKYCFLIAAMYLLKDLKI